MKNDFNNIKTAEITLMESQIELILRAIELYGHNLEYLLSCKDVNIELRASELAKLKYTYEQLQSVKANDIKGNSIFDDNNLTFIGKLLKNEEKSEGLKIV